MLGAAGGGNRLKASRVGALPNPGSLGIPRESIPDLQMATWDAQLHPERDAYEEHESQFQPLTQQASIEIPTGVLFPQAMALSLGRQHYSRSRPSPSANLKSVP